MVDVIDTLEGFDAIRKDWVRLEQASHLRIFQTYLWCRTAWDCYLSKEKGARLWILKWHRDGCDDCVIFPFYIDGARCLRFIMDGHSDICDSVYGLVSGSRYWAYREVADIISQTSSIKAVRLQKMVGSSELLNYLGVLLPGSVVSKDNAYSWLVSCKTDSFIEGQTQLKRKDRDRLKSIMRKGSGLSFAVLSARTNDSFPEHEIQELRSVMVNGIRHSGFLSPSLLRFIQKIYEEGMCEIPMLTKDNQIQALAFRLLKENHINYWIVLYRDKHMTTNLYLRYMISKAQQGDYIFDFGVGAYGYKLGTYRPALGITFSLRYAKSLWWQLRELFQANKRLLKDILKPRLH